MEFCVVMPKGKTYTYIKESLDKISIFTKTQKYISSNDATIVLNISDYISEIDESEKSEHVMNFIFSYVSLYPKGKKESHVPDFNFKHRMISTLFEKEEAPIFQELIHETHDLQRDKQSLDEIYIEDLYKIDMLLTAMRYTESLNMKILTKKLAAVVVMHLKDKNVNYIDKIFKEI